MTSLRTSAWEARQGKTLCNFFGLLLFAMKIFELLKVHTRNKPGTNLREPHKGRNLAIYVMSIKCI